MDVDELCKNIKAQIKSLFVLSKKLGTEVKELEKKKEELTKNSAEVLEDSPDSQLEPAAPTAKRDREPAATDESFVCPGKIWMDPPEPCDNGPRCKEKKGIQIIGADGAKKNVQVCKGCELKRAAQKRAEKKAKKE